MQTFITDFNITKSAKSLDSKRLGKQRVEALQILDCLLVKETRWKNHPAVKMWKGYEHFLLWTYIPLIMHEWKNRGYKNDKCGEWWGRLINLNLPIVEKYPDWLNEEFIESHRSNLIRKNFEYYKPLFPNTKEGLEYIWPIKKGDLL